MEPVAAVPGHGDRGSRAVRRVSVVRGGEAEIEVAVSEVPLVTMAPCDLRAAISDLALRRRVQVTGQLWRPPMLSLRRLAPLLFGAALVGCDDDSTGPGEVDLQVVARSFESLGRSRISAGDGSGAIASRAAALVLRAGIRPARVRITVDGVTEDYWALAMEHAVIPDLTGEPLLNDVRDSPILTLPIVSR